jgi:glycosyltransferase involved in cell wall biosynthesis
MMARYRTETAHAALLARYGAVTTLSAHMRDEAIGHGARPDRVHVLPPPIEGPADALLPPARLARLAEVTRPGEAVRVLCLGRLEPAKGGHVLIEAAPLVAAKLGRRVEVVFVGEGRSREEWARLAAAIGGATVSFPGRCDAAGRDRWFAWADLLVVPSLWPEPFGLVGAEAAAAGVAAVAFDVGGTRDWLHDGHTGRLAAGPAGAGTLADAVAWALGDAGRLRALSEAARARATGWSMARHADALLEVLRSAAGAPARD